MIKIDKRKIATYLGRSKFFRELALHYALAPSAVLIRTAEAELLSALPMEQPILDLCCGDGFFCSLICSNSVEAGCDFSMSALRKAYERKQYQEIVCADVIRGIPFRDEIFNTVICNSALEHVRDIDATLHEIARVLKPGGRLYTTFATQHAYKWWPCGHKALSRYLNFQPVFNYFSLHEWERRFGMAGLRIVNQEYYLSKSTSQLLMFIDYHFSHVSMTSDITLIRPVIRALGRIQSEVLALLWVILFAKVKILARGKGGGTLIAAVRKGMP